MPSENIGNDTQVGIMIPKGANTKAIAKLLKEKNFIINEDIFRFKSKIYKYDGRYNYGGFELALNMSNEEIMRYLTTEEGMGSLEQKLTVPEGYTVAQIAEKLESRGIVSKSEFIKIANSYNTKEYKFLKDIAKRENKLEGYLFPSTYEIPQDKDSKKIIAEMLKVFDNRFKPEYYDRARELGYTVDQIITIASIIEREAKKTDERAKISGVIYNRLKNNMKLEMCSTIQYAQGKVKEKLYEKDLQINSPYNDEVSVL
jgi:UPF0755 protein